KGAPLFFHTQVQGKSIFQFFFEIICKKLKMRKMCPENILKFFYGVSFRYGNRAGMDGNAVVGSFIDVGKLGLMVRLEDQTIWADLIVVFVPICKVGKVLFSGAGLRMVHRRLRRSPKKLGLIYCYKQVAPNEPGILRCDFG
ncbi:hypothetical protein L0657_27675, partial [Dyadobacter sp. CY345]|uniref:hypothetical protein n=1 Tax=Dyadobacter sp. CY345 TaxID=2909335 RepID=UPI001F220A02